MHGEVFDYLHRFPGLTEHQAQLRALLLEVTPHFVTYRTMERYASLRYQMRGPGGSGIIGDVDTLIASTALERNLTVVTMDADFQRVPNLKVQMLPRR